MLKLVTNRLPLPRCFSTSRLCAKLLIFNNRKHLRQFWQRVLSQPKLPGNTLGVVNGLIAEVSEGKTSFHYLSADPRYYCVIGLVRDFLYTEIITHEAVHAAFCYAKRVKRTPWDKEVLKMDEEAIAYPAGKIARAITNLIRDDL